MKTFSPDFGTNQPGIGDGNREMPTRLPATILSLLLALSPFARAAEKEKESGQEKGKTEEKDHEKAGGKEKEKESRVKRLPNGDVVVNLEEEEQKRIGLKLETLVAANLSPEVKGFGRVVDPAPLAALINELALAEVSLKVSRQELENTRQAREAEMSAAEAAVKASRQELARLKTLKAQDNASLRALEAGEAAAKRDEAQLISQKIAGARAVQAAEVAVQRDQAALDNVHTRALLAWGRPLLDQGELPTFSRQLAGQENALVRIEIPAGESLKAAPQGARVAPLNGELNWLEAESLGLVPGVDPQTQGAAYLFLVKKSGDKLPSNAAVTGYLKLPGEPLAGFTIPRAAIVRADGGAWVYVETGEDKFTRRLVTLDHPTTAGWFVTGGFTAKDEVVITGAQVLLSEEMRSQGGGGD